MQLMRDRMHYVGSNAAYAEELKLLKDVCEVGSRCGRLFLA